MRTNLIHVHLCVSVDYFYIVRCSNNTSNEKKAILSDWAPEYPSILLPLTTNKIKGRRMG